MQAVEKILPEFKENDPYKALKVSYETFQDTYDLKDCHGAGLSVLTIGDPHFKIDNLSEINVYISRILSIVKEYKPHFVVILGDLLHSHERLHTSVLNKAYMFIHKLRQLTPVYVLVGNHDYINNSQFLTNNHWMNAMKEWDNVFIVDKGMVIKSNYGKFIFCQYVYPGNFKKALELIDKEWYTSRSIFCHQELYGCKMGSIISEIGDKWGKNFPFIISGHIHDKQRPQDNIFYTGSSIQHAFGESHDKTITMCHFDERITLEDFDLELPKKKILYMDMDSIQKYRPSPESSDKIRITLSGTYEEFKVFRKSDQYKKLTKKGIKIIYRRLNSDYTASHVEVDDFHKILYNLIESEKNTHLHDLYNEIFSIS